MDTQQPLPLLGGMTPAQFMRRHWQKKPLLVRQAIAGFKPPVLRSELFALAAPAVEEALRARHAVYSNLVAFFVSNTVCYFANRWFVFRPGRHHAVVEFLLFLAVSAVSTVVGTTLMGILIQRFGIQTTYAFGANILSSLAINYVMRKFFVFKG